MAFNVYESVSNEWHSSLSGAEMLTSNGLFTEWIHEGRLLAPQIDESLILLTLTEFML